MLPFPTHKHAFPWYQNVIKDDQRIGVNPNRACIGELKGAALRIKGSADLCDALGIGRDGKGDRIIRIRLRHGPAGNDKYIITIGGSGNMHLGSSNHNAF